MGTLRDRTRSDNSWDPSDRPFIIGGLLLVAAVLVTFSLLLGLAALDVWSGIIVFLVIVSASVPVLRWVSRTEGDPWLFKIMYSALIVKLLFSLVRYFFIFVVYGGNGDAGVYHEAGSEFARRFAAGEPIHPLPVISNFPVETQWIGDVVGVFYTVTSPSAYAGFFFFSTLCFAGQVLIFRGFKVAVPEGDHRRMALLVLFLPSLLFWPSSLGKEAIMVACIGLVAYGGALLLAPRPQLRGIGFFALGLSALAFVRPHIAYMSVGALGLAMAVAVISGQRGPTGVTVKARLLRAVALVAVLGLASFAATRMGSALSGGEDGGTASTLQAASAQTAQGGSEFVPMSITTPLQVPGGVVSVLFRPFPWEARSVNALIAAAEGILLLGLFVASWRRLLSFPSLAMRRPFLVFAGAYVMVFAIGFSYLANFGILARQRTQMLPMVMVLLALPVLSTAAPRRRKNRPSLATVESTAVAGSVECDVAGAATAVQGGVDRWPS